MPLYVCPFGNPAMATAGMGDVLAGIAGALLAQNLPPMAAAVAATLIHAKAGDLAAEKSPVGLLASDLLSEIPHSF